MALDRQIRRLFALSMSRAEHEGPAAGDADLQEGYTLLQRAFAQHARRGRSGGEGASC